MKAKAKQKMFLFYGESITFLFFAVFPKLNIL